jgi:Tfp pilus assembly PilM family ATPase
VEPSRESNAYRLRLVAQKQRDISIVREGEAVRAEAVIGGHRAVLKKMYVNTHKVLAVPTVKYIELFGIDVATGETVSEKVLP